MTPERIEGAIQCRGARVDIDGAGNTPNHLTLDQLPRSSGLGSWASVRVGRWKLRPSAYWSRRLIVRAPVAGDAGGVALGRFETEPGRSAPGVQLAVSLHVGRSLSGRVEVDGRPAF